MAREGLVVDSQTLWDQPNAMARHLELREALGHRALDAPVINVDETRWAIMGTAKPATGTVWGVHAPTVSYYRILPGKSVEEGRAVLAGYRGIVVADGFAVYEVLARDGPGFTLAHCWAHTKRKYDEIATTWPTACAAIGALIGELYAIERLVPGSFPGDPGAQTLRAELRRDRSRPVLDQIWTWATEQAGLPRQRFRQSGALHAGTLDRPDAVCRESAHSSRQQRGRARTARPGRRPEKSLRLPLAARHAGRRPLLHAL